MHRVDGSRQGRRARGLASVVAGAALVAGLVTAQPAAAERPAQGPGPIQAEGATTVVIDGDSGGRTFDGVGAVSAGASSRLLYDYPEPERSEVLDYLFEPGYGAALQILKVEIGSDTNSTSGAEPSHMRTPDEVDCDRGYEWWLMKQAKKRNPDIALAGLQWGAPGWLDGGFWSQDNIDYLLAWLDCAEQHGLQIDYMGGWNEAETYDQEWYVEWSRQLKAEYPETEIIAADDEPHRGWRIADDLATDPELAEAIDVAGLHSACGHRSLYRRCESTQAARDLDQPLWISELSSMAHDAGAEALARGINRMYVDAEITGLMAWSPVSAWYANLPLADTGLMVAEWPWSGFYDVGDSIWTYAHTTQFTQRGWSYLDQGSARDESGFTHAALASPSGEDWSTVVETMDLSRTTTATFDVENLPAGRLQLWSTDLGSDDASDRFRHHGTVDTADGSFTLELEPDHLYTVSTLTAAAKGDAVPTEGVDARMRIPFSEDFESVPSGHTARFFSDLAGAFESVPCGGERSGSCYRQVVTEAPISWGLVGEVPLTTVFGDPRWWGDYAVRSDVLLEGEGHVAVGGRVSGQSWGTAASGYHFRIGTDGWSLRSRDHATGRDVVLASGQRAIDVGTWHEVELRMRGRRISVYLDGERLTRVEDTTQRTGNAALTVSAWQNAQFDDVRVEPTGPGPRFHEASTATATSEHGFFRGWTHEAEHAVDDRPETTWSSAFDPAGLPQQVTVDLGAPERTQALTYQPRLDGNGSGMITDYAVEVSTDGRTFERVARGRWSADSSTKVAAWDERDARYVRLTALPRDDCADSVATAGELRVVDGAGIDLTTTPDDTSSPLDQPPDGFGRLVPQRQTSATATSAHSDPYLACRAVDGRRSTFWHSAPAATSPLPASVTLDLAQSQPVQGLAYLPRQDGNANGNVTEYVISVSRDGQHFTDVATGTWPDDDTMKFTTWPATDARHVRLTAVEGHFGVAAAAELHVARADQ